MPISPIHFIRPAYVCVGDYTASSLHTPNAYGGVRPQSRPVLMALPVPWCLSRRQHYPSSPPGGGRLLATPVGEQDAAAPAARVNQNWFHHSTVPRTVLVLYCTALRGTVPRYVVSSPHEAIAFPGADARVAASPCASSPRTTASDSSFPGPYDGGASRWGVSGSAKRDGERD
jgi:hypothetical protein